MDGLENTGLRQSRIPHPKSTVAAGLQEMNESQHNARAQPTSMRIPPPTGMKRPGSEIQPQPDPKRQTLVEREAEYPGTRSVASHAVAPVLNTVVKPASIVSLASKEKQTTKLAKPTVSYRHSTRAAPNTALRPLAAGRSLAQSVGPGAAAHDRSKQAVEARYRPQLTRARPATAMDRYDENDAEHPPTDGKHGLDVDERIKGMESHFLCLKDTMEASLADRRSLEELVELNKARANDLQRQRDQLEEKNTAAQSELSTLRQQLQRATLALEGERNKQSYNAQLQSLEHQGKLDALRKELKDSLERQQQSHTEALDAMARRRQEELAEERSRHACAIQELQAKLAAGQQSLDLELQEKERELQRSRATASELQAGLDREHSLKAALQKQLVEAASAQVALEERLRATQAQVDFLKSDSRQQSDQFATMEARMQQALNIADEARQKLIKEETERRILFNKYQELKGNIRVMCRVRPALDSTGSGEARFAYPDAKASSAQIDVTGPEEKSSLGTTSRKTIPFEFDRVFAPGVQNDEVFGEISQLVQSALDGFNVCIFCYGQTGSGKTYTMAAPDGMIPRATHMIYDSIKRLGEKSWAYTMEGSFVEVYNEELHDLLKGPGSSGSSAKDQEPTRKLEIRHDEARKTTTVVNCKTVQLDSEAEVEAMLQLAQRNRSVAATKANERSSRSHSIFILKLVGENMATGERCEGTLNLVDLAGSERLKHSGAEGERKKETQNINRSLACLGDVIEALGRGAPHIPYRNSKLTHLLQYSLGGNSKTLMFVMVSPLEDHLKETLTSLRFATKVHNTHIGTAKSTKKLKSRASDE